jgi:hypothetical protein
MEGSGGDIIEETEEDDWKPATIADTSRIEELLLVFVGIGIF